MNTEHGDMLIRGWMSTEQGRVLLDRQVIVNTEHGNVPIKGRVNVKQEMSSLADLF